MSNVGSVGASQPTYSVGNIKKDINLSVAQDSKEYNQITKNLDQAAQGYLDALNTTKNKKIKVMIDGKMKEVDMKPEAQQFHYKRQYDKLVLVRKAMTEFFSNKFQMTYQLIGKLSLR